MSKKELEKLLLGAIIAKIEQSVKMICHYLEAHPDSKLGEMECLIREMSQECFAHVLSKLIEVRSEETEGGCVCSQCGKRMRNKGRQKRQCVTLVGQITWERRYY